MNLRKDHSYVRGFASFSHFLIEHIGLSAFRRTRLIGTCRLNSENSLLLAPRFRPGCVSTTVIVLPEGRIGHVVFVVSLSCINGRSRRQVLISEHGPILRRGTSCYRRFSANRWIARECVLTV